MRYTTVRTLWRLGLFSFFRSIEIAGAEKLPRDGGVLLVSNHLNAFVDGMLLVALLKRPVRVTAKATLRKNPFFRFLLDSIGAVTFQRAEDGEPQSGNAAALDAAVQALAKGEQVLIFPEGFSHSDGALRPFKRGAAKIALDAAAANGTFSVVPLGLVYPEKHRFRSDVVVCIGEPIPAAQVLAAASSETLTDQLRAAVSKCCLELPPETMRLYHWLASVTLGTRALPYRLGEPSSLVPLISEIQQLVALRGALDPSTAATIEHQARELYQLTGNGAIRPHELFLPLSVFRAVVFLLRELEILLFGLPLAILGALIAAPAYLLTRLLVRKTAQDDDHVATHAIFLGIPIFLLFTLLESAVAASCFGWIWGLLFLLLAPYLQRIAVLYRDRFGEAACRASSFLHLAAKPALREKVRSAASALAASIESLRSGVSL